MVGEYEGGEGMEVFGGYEVVVEGLGVGVEVEE